MRPTLEELAQRRAEAQRFLARNPGDVNAPMIRVLLAATAPPTKDEAIPIMVRNANESGNWSPKDGDETLAEIAIGREPGEAYSAWEASIRAQWQTLTHFMGGAREP